MAQRGFTLVEVLIAMALLVVVALSAAQLLAATASAIRVARAKSAASAFAAARIERLRGERDLRVSPPDALRRNVDGFSTYLDAGGVPVAAVTGVPPGAVYVSRWDVAASPTDDRLLVIQVLVRPVAEDAAGERFSRGEVRLTTVRRRER
jgi:prepilin-type N-terminal cleavage/methylation domain-containing protein